MVCGGFLRLEDWWLHVLTAQPREGVPIQMVPVELAVPVLVLAWDFHHLVLVPAGPECSLDTSALYTSGLYAPINLHMDRSVGIAANPPFPLYSWTWCDVTVVLDQDINAGAGESAWKSASMMQQHSDVCMNSLLEKNKNESPVFLGKSTFGKNISNLTVSNEGIASQQFHLKQLFADSLWARIDPSWSFKKQKHKMVFSQCVTL